MSDVKDDGFKGLSASEAAERLRRYGPNELPMQGRRGLLKVALEALREPMLLLLIAASAIYLALGDVHEGLLLAGLAVLDLGLVVYQDYKTERVLESLRDLASPRALVIRDGVQRRIAGRDVVPGDLVIVREGDRVPADAEVLSASDLSADESLLTGESVPVRKRPARDTGSDHAPHPGGEDLPFVFSGTLIVRGQGTARIVETGLQTEIGRIGKSLAAIEFEETRLRTTTRRLARNMAVFAAVISLLVIVLYGMRAGDWIAAALAGIATAMSMIPEEIPIILTVFLTLGAWRISRRNVLTRRVSAIESLGAATVLCTDKTGTLTVNRMTIVRLWNGRRSLPIREGQAIPEDTVELLRTGALACEPVPTDPMEQAFHRMVALAPNREALRVYGLTQQLLAVVYVWAGEAEGRHLVAAKGAPEAIAELCRLEAKQTNELLHQTRLMAEDGLRVLAVATAENSGPLPDDARGFDFRLLGLVGLSDPVRDTVPAAVAECRRAGIRVLMVTGDYPETARAIAAQAGIDSQNAVVTGAQLAGMDEAALSRALQDTNVFARTRPEQKLRLVSALKASGEIVAMTGDGVNDAPALKAAHIGIAMGGRGSDVAREAATLVLLDDAFESIAAAVRLGRRIYDNLRKALSYVLAVHVPIAGLALAPLLAGWPIVFSPVHIVFLELIIDPISSIAFEAEPGDADIMRRPPRRPDEPLFGTRDVLLALTQGAVALGAVLGAYAAALARGFVEDEARAVAFAAIVVVNVVLVLANRSGARFALISLIRPNAALWLVLGTAVAALAICIYVPPAAALFRFAPLGGSGLLLSVIPAFIVFLTIEALLFARSRR